MPQEHYVLKCFSCETFQSHIVKKTNKWTCKVCGEKQTVKKVYGRGSGKDCRVHTQKLNGLKGEKEQSQIEQQWEEVTEDIPENSQNKQTSSFSKGKPTSSKTSKWSEYVDDVKINNENQNYYESKNLDHTYATNIIPFDSNVNVKRKYFETNVVEEDPYNVDFNELVTSDYSGFSCPGQFGSAKKIKENTYNCAQNDNYFVQQDYSVELCEDGSTGSNSQFSVMSAEPVNSDAQNEFSKWAKYLGDELVEDEQYNHEDLLVL
ncbi:MRN complex-interacting protein isoform X1 [Homalodisca vitripennis]|uniref:MRN complex-interacting protein isoform X1 n=1 Tax=Homalodisca vitripennis TaxID=197043 RepID=UPI001EEBF850|nr:MRN complex-interacting protein isoform X1 [Homalodisca vitripennis]